MTSKPNHFDVLEVGLDASPEDIRKAYLDKARRYHPDSQRNPTAKDLAASDELMKGINLAYEVLRDSEKRLAYRQSINGRAASPIPTVESVGVNVSNATPGVTYTGYIIVSNIGGPYSKLKATPSAAWIKIASLRPLTPESQLPLRVEVDMHVENWSCQYKESLTISLDEVSVTTPVSVQTRSRPIPTTSERHASAAENATDSERTINNVTRVSPDQHAGRSLFGRGMNQTPDKSLYTHTGKIIGASSGGLLALAATIWVAVQGAEALARWPSVAATFGILGGVYMGYVLIPAATAAGYGAGWLAGTGAWIMRKIIHNAT